MPLEDAEAVASALLGDDPALALGLNTHAGEVVCGPVAEAFGVEHRPLSEVLA